MKKIIILLALGLSIFASSCSKDDDPEQKPKTTKPAVVPTTVKGYAMPFLHTSPIIIKDFLLKISDNVVETKRKGYYKLTCAPKASNVNMFSSLTYEFTTEELDFKGLNFSYKFDKALNLTQADKDKVIAYLKTQILR
ncbi:MAG: hypothetical protein WBG43_03600 [Marinifilaceae bacterium]